MSQPTTALPPHWLDAVIESAGEKADERKIAQIIANCPQIMNAIKEGLKVSQPAGMVGPSRAQEIRRRVQEVVAG